GGPLVDKYAQLGDPNKFSFTKPKVGDLDFSFSGLKTGILYFIQKNVKINPTFIEDNLYDICASIQHTIVEILMQKLKNTVKKTGIKHVAIAGGVSANSEIRKRLQLANKHLGWTTYIPKFEYTTDNAAMIAITGYLKYKEKKYADISVKAEARLNVSE
ncbi:MAG: tRNA (adenosine(37)-N6)-threonylcarbamoyltransferase complex transferase subunit TsaD, partial [Flavobacteriaceae bacterium]